MPIGHPNSFSAIFAKNHTFHEHKHRSRACFVRVRAELSVLMSQIASAGRRAASYDGICLTVIVLVKKTCSREYKLLRKCNFRQYSFSSVVLIARSDSVVPTRLSSLRKHAPESVNYFENATFDGDCPSQKNMP